VLAPRHGPVKQRRVLTADHVTALLCLSADWKWIPPLIIFKESFPHRQYKDGCPGKVSHRIHNIAFKSEF